MTTLTHHFAIATLEPDCGCLVGVSFASDAGPIREWLDEQPDDARVVVITPPEDISVSRFCAHHKPVYAEPKP